MGHCKAPPQRAAATGNVMAVRPPRRRRPACSVSARQQQELARLAASQVLSQASRDRPRVPARPRCVALEARGCECSEQAGSDLDAVASVDVPAVAHLLRDGELELLVNAELGADVVETFKELLTLGTVQNPSVAGAVHAAPLRGRSIKRRFSTCPPANTGPAAPPSRIRASAPAWRARAARYGSR